MTWLKETPQVQDIAKRLGVQSRDDPVSEIVNYAVARVEDFADPFDISTLDGFTRLVAAHVDVKIEHICSDEDVDTMVVHFGQVDEVKGAFIRDEFLTVGGTEGLLLQNPYRGIKPGARRYVALIDVRGKQRNRAYFTTWHELAHLLIIPSGEPYAPKRRSPSEEKKQVDPEECLVDMIAGKLAFYEPLFGPMLEHAVSEEGGMNFNAIERVAGEASTGTVTASLWATARAGIQILGCPACLLEVARRHKASVNRHLQKAAGDLFGHKPQRELRINQCIYNNEARTLGGIELRKNMRVPKRSVLTNTHYDIQGRYSCQNIENQSWWETSADGTLSALQLRVCAVKRGSRTYGLVMPVL